jgi:hypothetical protein
VSSNDATEDVYESESRGKSKHLGNAKHSLDVSVHDVTKVRDEDELSVEENIDVDGHEKRDDSRNYELE